jgi:1,4-dihydroxy-2-naphthoyl-CoA hydrolase
MWIDGVTVEGLNEIGKNTMGEHLGMKFTEIGEDFLKAEMPVTANSVQPMRILHGGASVAFAETLGSVASVISSQKARKNGAVGIEINANHLKAVHEGDTITGIVSPIRVGKTIHVWDIKIYNSKNKLSCISRLTTMVLDDRK